MEWNAFFNLMITIAVGYITYTLKDKEVKTEKRLEKVEVSLQCNERDLSDTKKEMYSKFVTQDTHNRDMNALEKKVDDIKDILMDIKHDIGRLTGEINSGH